MAATQEITALNAPALPAGMTVFERGWLSSNNILLQGEGGPTALIDSGYATHAPQTLALVETALAERPLDLLVNTHLHSDHCGGNAALQQRHPDMQTAIPPGQADAVAAWDEDALSFLGTGQQCPRFRYEQLLVPGTVSRLGAQHWEIHAAPGHDPHSVILFEPASRTLLSADALWQNGFGVVFPELFGEPGFDEVAATFDLIENLHPTVVVPGHGGIFSNVAEALVVARRRLEGQARAPMKHAWHAMKVLTKFRLLEISETSRTELAAWFACTPYLQTMRRIFFAGQNADLLFEQLLEELHATGALALSDDRVRND